MLNCNTIMYWKDYTYIDKMEVYNMMWQAKWIKPNKNYNEICPIFSKSFNITSKLKTAKLYITAMGVYEAELNGQRIGSFILAPGWTSYKNRLQYQEYDITDLLNEKNSLQVIVGKGWYRGRLPGWANSALQDELKAMPAGLIAQVELIYENGSREIIISDETWETAESCVRFSEIYDGETYDASYQVSGYEPALIFDGPSSTLIPQEGEEVREQERLYPAKLFTTPKGECVIDFGQVITGYVEIKLSAKKGEEVELSHAEVLDKDGNFYTENYRGAKAKYHYICKDGQQAYKSKLTFYGFRYIRIDQFPGGVGNASIENFIAVVVHSDMKRIGHLDSSNPLLNQLFSNIIWGQKGNFLDVPTDCPQRDERLGWTGDAQVFIKTACMNYQAEKFFAKWLNDMAADQREDGCVGHVIPDILNAPNGSAAWGDAACICPWELYLAYGNVELLGAQFECMKKWVDYITTHTNDKYLWTGGEHYGDWLGLDAEPGSYKGSSREDFIASAFYAYSTSLVVKAGKTIGKDVSEYEALYHQIVEAFRLVYPVYNTQTECVLAVHFKLAIDPQKAADQLAVMVEEAGVCLKTGFVGTPYLLHVLSNYGYSELAYSLVLRTKYPSWLYPVTKGATTIWEHWDGIMENGDFWSKDMNSFNHYAYGAVADWFYSVVAGIKVMDEYPGFEKVTIAPIPDERIDWFSASIETKYGLIRSEWKKDNENIRYEIKTPVDAWILINGKEYEVTKGAYVFYNN